MSQIFELIRCDVCKFHKPANEDCRMCELIAEEQES